VTPKEAAIKAVEIWNACTEEINTNLSKATSAEIRITVFQAACHFTTSDKISSERRAERSDQLQKPKSNVRCYRCGRNLTEKEKAYCDDRDQDYICYQCSRG